MDRRQALAAIGALGLCEPAFGLPEWVGNPYITNFGALKPRRPRADRTRFYNTFTPFRGISREVGKDVFLFHNLQKQIGEIVPHTQRNHADGSSGEGDCVGHAAAMGCDILAATDIHMLGQRERWEAKASVEMIYAGSRVEVGQNVMDGRQGAWGVWGARYLKQYGVLHRKEYNDGDGNTIDLRGYHPRRSRKYRDVGVPDWLESIAREHPVQEITNVQTGQEALDAVCAGQPVLMCSSYAFHDTRDAKGFAEPYLSFTERRRRGWRWVNVRLRVQWWHAMILTGAVLEGGRIGGTIQNSHANWNSGPRPNGMPVGSFNVDLRHLHTMVTDWFECYALASYKGHESKKMRRRIQLYLR